MGDDARQADIQKMFDAVGEEFHRLLATVRQHLLSKRGPPRLDRRREASLRPPHPG